MFLETGYVYHIKDEYFEFAKTVRNQAVAVVEGTQKEITDKVNKIFKLKSKRNKFNISRCG